MRALALLSLLLGIGNLHAQVDRFDRWDVNKDGKITPEEAPRGLRAKFAEVDTDGDGSISREELRKIAPLLADSATYDFLHDIDYVGDGLFAQRLDLLLPKDREGKKLPLIVFIHGGGWAQGAKEDGISILRAFMVEGDYATATLNYRLTDQAKWPAQIHDCKAAIRFLRSKAAVYGFDADHIGVIGISSGGQLAAMLGVSGGVDVLDGNLGPACNETTKVQCVVNLFGPQDFLTINGQAAADPVMAEELESTELKLFGDKVANVPDIARQASPVTWITKGAAPCFTAHATKDPEIPYAQAEEFHAALKKAGAESWLIPMEGGGQGMLNCEVNERIRTFLDKNLCGKPGDISSERIVIAR
jgi:acetyl esterase/lipase